MQGSLSNRLYSFSSKCKLGIDLPREYTACPQEHPKLGFTAETQLPALCSYSLSVLFVTTNLQQACDPTSWAPLNPTLQLQLETLPLLTPTLRFPDRHAEVHIRCMPPAPTGHLLAGCAVTPSTQLPALYHAFLCSTSSSQACVSGAHRGPYEEYAASPHWAPPSLALACDSGIGEHETAAWLKAVKVLLDHDVPCCFTSYQTIEGKGEGLNCASGHALLSLVLVRGIRV
jgi:hypothetical protein